MFWTTVGALREDVAYIICVADEVGFHSWTLAWRENGEWVDDDERIEREGRTVTHWHALPRVPTPPEGIEWGW